MKKKYQVTMFCSTGAYKPVACIITEEQEDNTDLSKDLTQRKALIEKGVKKICAIKYWTKNDVKKYGFTRVKIRVVE